MTEIKHFFTTFFKDKHGKIAIFQAPNIPLGVWIIATLLTKLFAQGSLHTVFDIIAYGAIVIWSYLEITKGISPFRRVLGAIVLVASIYGRL